MNLSITSELNKHCNGKSCTDNHVNIVINEIGPTPTLNNNSIWGQAQGEPTYKQKGEWVELYNTNRCASIDISGYFLGNNSRDNKNNVSGNYGAAFRIPSGTIIPPNGFCVIRGRNALSVPSAQLVQNGGKTVEIVVQDNMDVCVDGGFRFFLPDLGGWIALYDNYGTPLDAASWASIAPSVVCTSCSTCVVNNATFSGRLASYDDILSTRKTYVYSSSLSDLTSQNRTLRREPDGKDWVLNSIAPPTMGSCNTICNSTSSTISCTGTATVTVSGGTPPYYYQWDDPEIQLTATAERLCAGKYTVYVTDQTHSRDSIQVTILNNKAPLPNLGGDTSICGNKLLLDAGSGYDSIYWSTGSNDQSIVVTTDNKYIVVVFDSYQCTNTDTIGVAFHDNPIVFLGNDTTFCANSLTLDVGGGFTQYDWSTGSHDQSIVINSGGTYHVKVKDQWGCSGNDTVELILLALPVVDLGNDISVCTDSIIQLEVGPGFIRYEWSDGSQAPTLVVSSEGTYFVKVTDANQCANVDSISIIYYPVPMLILGNDTTVCAPGFTIDAGKEFTHYQWSTGITDQKSIKVTDEGTYSLMVTDQNGCVNSDSIQISFNPTPIIEYIDSSLNNQLVIHVKKGNKEPYLYSLNNRDYQYDKIFSDLSEGTYTFFVRDGNGCIDSISTSYHKKLIIISNFFTPNSDGINDLWEIEGIQSFPLADIQLYDRSGKQIAKYKGSDTGWDGTYNGKALKSDDYWYIINLNYNNKVYKGHVTLKR